MNKLRPVSGDHRTKEALASINRLLDERFGRHIEEIVRVSKRPELRPTLKRLFFELTYFQHLISKAKNLDELESALDRNAELLEQRAQSLQEKLQQAAKERNAALREDYATWKSEYAKLANDWEVERKEAVSNDADPDNREVDSLMGEAEQIFRGYEGTMDNFFRTTTHLEDVLLDIDRDTLTKGLARFRRWRRFRRTVRAVGYFTWGVLILGVLFSLFQTAITGVFTQLWVMLAITFIASCLSLYYFGPWLSKRELEKQRKHLLASLRDFYQANIQITLLTPMKEERIKHLKDKGRWRLK